MSNLEDSKPSLKNRLKPHIPALVIGVTAGVIVTIIIYRRIPVKMTGDIWLSKTMLQQIKENGSAMFQTEETGQLVDLIDWAHPKMLELSNHVSK